MIGQMFAESLNAYRQWSEEVTEVLFLPWRLYLQEWERDEKQIVPANSETAGETSPPAEQGEPVENIEEWARERAKQGLPPPRDIYLTPQRRNIDWMKFPLWARPSDPELFGDSPHEG